jgi:hypothetical protein
MCETSFITVTDAQMQYMATNFRQDLGFHHPPDDRDAFEGVWLIQKTGSSLHFLGKMVIFFHILKRNIWKVCALPPKFSVEWRPSKDKKVSKNHQKRLQNWHFLAFLGGFSAKGTWVSIFFWYYDLSEALEQLLEWKKKVLKFLWKSTFFLIDLSTKLTVCCKWLWNPSKWCQLVMKCQFYIPMCILNYQES